MTDPRIMKVKKQVLRARQPKLPDGPYIVDDVVTANGLRAVTLLAANGAPQTKVASALGLTARQLKKRLGTVDDDTSLRLAWETGRADLEYEVATILLEQARAGNVVAAIFYSKSQLNWVDVPQATQTVGIQIVVPDSLSREQWQARLPQVTVIEPDVSQDATPKGLLTR